jgi:hypothetical protein
VQDDFHVYLLGCEAAGTQGVLFVYELDGDDGFGRIRRDGFADAAGEIWLAEGLDERDRVCRSVIRLTRHMRPGLWSY